MAETSTTTDTAAKTIPLAMHAITQHALDHGLVTWRIEHQTWHPTDGIHIAVDREHAAAWLDTLTVLGDPDVRRSSVADRAHIEMLSYPALIPSPIGNVRVTLVTSRETAPLRLVGSAS